MRGGERWVRPAGEGGRRAQLASRGFKTAADSSGFVLVCIKRLAAPTLGVVEVCLGGAGRRQRGRLLLLGVMRLTQKSPFSGWGAIAAFCEATAAS